MTTSKKITKKRRQNFTFSTRAMPAVTCKIHRCRRPWGPTNYFNFMFVFLGEVTASKTHGKAIQGHAAVDPQDMVQFSQILLST